MLFMDELQPLRLYSGKRKVLIPFNEKDKRHGAAIFLMSSSQEQNEKMMNTPYIHNNQLYKAYYMDRNAMQYINSDAVNNAEEEFDELQEAVLSEGMFHSEKTKFLFENASTMDERVIKKIYNKDSVDYACGILGIKDCPVDTFIVQFHSNLNSLRKSYPDFKNRTDDKQFYSFTDHKSTIHLLSYIVYDEKNMDGPYEMYARNELLYCIIVNEYPTINRKLANCVAMALSGQVEWLRDEKKKEEFKYMSDDKEHIDNLYLADLILQVYQTKGSRGIKKLLNGDVSVLSSVASGRIIRDTKKLFKRSLTEANLSSKERNELKDSDFGIPSKRKYPMPDAAHVKAAIRMFNHCDPEDEAELARHIKAKMKKYNVSADIGENNRLSKYIHESDILQENWIFNSDDIYLNFDEWKPKKKNILYVTGLSGSGKSTLANELGLKYKAEVISLDLLVLSCFADKAKAARNQAKLSPTMKKYWDSEDHETILKWGDSAVTVEINHFLNWLNDNYYHSDDLYIVEGYELAAECPVKFLVNQPLIIKGTSTLTSILRRGKRSYLMKIDKGESVFDATVDGLKDIYRVIEGGRFIRNQLVLDQFKDLLNTVSNLNESAAVTDPSGINGLEYADDGYLFSGDYSEDYYAVLEITKDFTKEEYDRISFYPTYRESKYITKRIILRDPNEYPMCFMDVYHFPSDPERAQITTAVGKGFRGHGLCGEMLKKLLNSGFAEENGIKKYIWHVHPGNDASEHIASSNGFVKASDKLDKYGRMTYVYNVDQSAEANSITLPAISTESGVLMESGAIVYTEDLVDSKYDSKMKRYLYKERIKNKRDVTAIYDQVKQRNPIIQKTFRNVKLYNRLNVFVDTSYYHNLYLKNAFKNSKRSYYMYFDFLNRLMENEEIFKSYNKITYYFPVQFTRNGNTVDNLLDIKIDLNPLSLIIYFLKKDNEPLKRWANKEIVFLGDKGYFKVNFANFTIKNLQKFRKNVTRLLSKEEIGEDEDMDEFEPEDSPKAMAAETLDVIEKNTGVKIDDISGISSIKIKHLSMDTLTPKLIDEKSSNAIMILGTNSDAVISMISDKSLRSKDIQTYYKPKI